MNPISLRKATPADASNILKLLLQWHQTSRIDYPPMREMDTLSWITDTMVGGTVIVAERAGRLIGALAIVEQAFPWNRHDRVLHDAFFFVAESYRKGGVAAAMLTAAKNIAAARNVPLIISAIGGTSAEKVDRWYQISGGQYAGGTYVFGLMNGKGEEHGVAG